MPIINVSVCFGGGGTLKGIVRYGVIIFPLAFNA